MYCPYCGTEIPDDDNIEFCFMCGRKLTDISHESSDDERKDPVIQQRLEFILPLISLIFGLISCICVLFFYRLGFIGVFGAVLGFSQFSQKNKYQWMSYVGIVLSILAILILLFRLLTGRV